MKTIVRSPEGADRREVDLDAIDIPDLWSLGHRLKQEGREREGDMVLECWHLCHDLRWNLCNSMDAH